MRAAALLSIALLPVGLLVAGCGTPSGAATPKMDHLTGERVGTMAEQQLENEHPGMAAGEVTCPDLKWRVGAAVRCVQVAVLSGGRQLRINGTVKVVSLRDGGRLHVELDDHVAEYGITPERLQSDLAAVVLRRVRRAATKVTCPYLSGPIGHSVRCTLHVGGRQAAASATVIGLDAQDYQTSYQFKLYLRDRTKSG
jgi:hypothetical protein